MIFDITTLLSNAQAITATAPSTNVIDTGAAGTIYGVSSAMVKDIGKGEDVYVNAQVVQAFNNLTSLQVDLQSSDDVAFGSGVTTITLGTYALATLVAGRVLNWQELPSGVKGRYLRLNYTVTGTAPTTGQITAGLVFGPQSAGVNFG